MEIKQTLNTMLIETLQWEDNRFIIRQAYFEFPIFSLPSIRETMKSHISMNIVTFNVELCSRAY